MPGAAHAGPVRARAARSAVRVTLRPRAPAFLRHPARGADRCRTTRRTRGVVCGEEKAGARGPRASVRGGSARVFFFKKAAAVLVYFLKKQSGTALILFF